jgi:hypothetical protein
MVCDLHYCIIETGGFMKNKKGSFTHNLGDMIERIGEKISNLGGTKIGRKVYESGNKLEHKNDKVKQVKKPLP